MAGMKNRIWFYDNLKFVLITLVVIGHFLQEFLYGRIETGTFLFIYSFHMPLFIFVTGFFAKKVINGDTNSRLNKILSYLILYLIFKLLMFLLLSYVYNQPYRFSFINEYQAPWYLMACVVWFILTNTVKNVKPLYMFIFSILCSIFISYEVNLSDQISLYRVIVFYPFFLLGYYLTKEQMTKVIEVLHKRKIYILLAILFLIGVYAVFVYFAHDLYFLRNLFTGRNSFLTMDFPFDILFTGALFRVLWLTLVFLIGIAIFILIPTKKTIFSEFGSRTLQVYVLHILVVICLLNSPVIMWCADLLGGRLDLACIILGILTSIVLSLKIFEKPFTKIFSLDFKKIYSNK